DGLTGEALGDERRLRTTRRCERWVTLPVHERERAGRIRRLGLTVAHDQQLGAAGRAAKTRLRVALAAGVLGHSADREQVDHEHERLVRTDHAARAPLAVGEVGRDRDAPPAADAHARHTLVPSLDDLPGAEPEPERLAAVPRRVELLARPPGHADVVHLDVAAGRRLVAVADLEVFDGESRRGRLAGRDEDGRLLVGGHAAHATSGVARA